MPVPPPVIHAMRFVELFMMTSLSVWLESLRRERSFGSQQPPEKIGRPNLHYVKG
jgi:hypothetical protein